MSQQLTAAPLRNGHSNGRAVDTERQQLEKLCSSIRGKLQFMDYLVRAAVADVDRFQAEEDAGTRIFLRQLIEMHAANLSVESENMRLMGELCSSLETAIAHPTRPQGPSQRRRRMTPEPRPFGGGGNGAALLGCVTAPGRDMPPPAPAGSARGVAPELVRSLAEIKGQAQFLLYLADQIEDALGQVASESDPGHAAFLCKVLGMYSAQMESKHQGLGDKIAETCQEVYVTVREFDMA